MTPLRHCPNIVMTARMFTHFIIQNIKYLQTFLVATLPILIFLSFINEMTTFPKLERKKQKDKRMAGSALGHSYLKKTV